MLQNLCLPVFTATFQNDLQVVRLSCFYGSFLFGFVDKESQGCISLVHPASQIFTRALPSDRGVTRLGLSGSRITWSVPESCGCSMDELLGKSMERFEDFRNHLGKRFILSNDPNDDI